MKVLNFGSLNIDNVYTMAHFVRPGETVSSLSLQNFAGGKGLNQSVALANAGARVSHAGAVGEDGAFLVEFLRKKGVDTSLIRTLPGRTGHAIIQVEQGGQNCIILHGGANRGITEEQINETLSHFGPGDILLLQNEISNNRLIIDRACERGMKIALNPSPIDGEVLSLPLEKVSWFLMNEIEGAELTGEREPEEILTQMRRRYPGSTTVLTLGKQGVAADDGRSHCRHGIYDVPVVDTTAAGDTFTGYFLCCAAQGLPLAECLELASRASSMAVGTKGAAESIPLMADVHRAVLRPL